MAEILVVDDHPAIRMAVSLLLAQDGHVICAEVDNGVDAIQQFKKNAPREGANKRGNSSRLTQSFHFFMFEPFFLP